MICMPLIMVMHADDVCLMVQKLINICYDFGIQNNLSFNLSKSFCMDLHKEKSVHYFIITR